MSKLEKIAKAALLAAPLVLGLPGCKKVDTKRSDNQTRVEQVQNQNEEYRNTVLAYLKHPEFRNPEFTEQITGTKAKLELINAYERKVYMSIDEDDYEEKTLERLVTDKDSVEFGRTSNNKFSAKNRGEGVRLGDYILPRTNHYFFRFPEDKFKVNKNAKITVKYNSADYSINISELSNFLHNRSIYGGYLLAVRRETGDLISNHGAFVAKKEPSLTRLVNTLVGDMHNRNKEEVAQRLLDFVTREIEYVPIRDSRERLARPNEVLMSKKADCSGHAILFASLLEQAGIDYRLLYFKNHIAVAVEGDYLNINGLSFNLDGKTYSIAETTAKNFQIGISSIIDGNNHRIGIEDIKEIQKPKDSRIYEFKIIQKPDGERVYTTGKALPWR